MVLDVRFLTMLDILTLPFFTQPLFSCFLDCGCFSCILYCFYILYAFFDCLCICSVQLLYFSSNHFVVIMVISASMRH